MKSYCIYCTASRVCWQILYIRGKNVCKARRWIKWLLQFHNTKWNICKQRNPKQNSKLNIMSCLQNNSFIYTFLYMYVPFSLSHHQIILYIQYVRLYVHEISSKIYWFFLLFCENKNITNISSQWNPLLTLPFSSI